MHRFALTTPLRALAYDVITRRDGLDGWKVHRDRFRSLAASPQAENRAYSLDALRRLLTHAYETVPYYRETWQQVGFTPSRNTTFADLARLPILTKADVRDRKTELVSQRFSPKALRLDYTGGTTGTQTAFYRDHDCGVARFGRQWGILERCGYRPGQKRALIWGAHADVAPVHAGQRLKRTFRQFACAEEVKCCVVMGPSDMQEYYDRLRRFKPDVIYGYPNAIEEFARFVDRRRLRPIRVRRVICTAEYLHPAQRALFGESFGGEVFNLYCSREHGCVGFECGRHDRFHVDSGSVIVEILRDGREVGAQETGEIVTTDLLNYGMPLIRYATGDLARAAASSSCDCGCALPAFSELQGRVADTLLRPDGSTVAGLMLTDLFMEEPAITHAQFVQHDPTSLDVYLVLNGVVRHDIRTAASNEVRSVMGPDMTIRIQVVDEIPRNPRSGKYQEVLCLVPGRATTESEERSLVH